MIRQKPKPNVELKLALWERKMSQRDLAYALGIDEARISRVIRGFEKPTGDMKEDIAEYLGMDEDELFPRLPLRY